MKYMEKINESEFINQILFHQNTNINQYFFFRCAPPFRWNLKSACTSVNKKVL